MIAAVVVVVLCVGFLWRRRKHAASVELKTWVGSVGAPDGAAGAVGTTTTPNPTFVGATADLYENVQTHCAGMPVYANGLDDDDDGFHDYENSPADEFYEAIDRPTTSAARAPESDTESLYETIDAKPAAPASENNSDSQYVNGPGARPMAIFPPIGGYQQPVDNELAPASENNSDSQYEAIFPPIGNYQEPVDNELYEEINRPAPPRLRKGMPAAAGAMDPIDGEYDDVVTMGRPAAKTQCQYTSDRDGQKCHNMVDPGSSPFCPNHLCASPACGNSKRSSEQRCASCAASHSDRELYVNTGAGSGKKPGGIRRADRKGSVYDGFDERG